ncbi:hypothetical protein HDV00_001200 [Rhizophlyctis rosea]|nr:hypothetical protein HDV00_001200 [Rhizophlyctis rosea]
MDYDQISYNDSIGTVYVDLDPLLTWDSQAQISGWIPIFDTLRGIRGEINCQIKLQFFGDINPFKDSSAGVQFFNLSSLPSTFHVVSSLGFVSALMNDDDPEYHWSDNFRTPRTSNEARTRIMYRLAGQLRRQLGKKALELGGNAVIGFKQYFDMESEQRAITARAIGTAVRLALPDEAPRIDRGTSWMSVSTPYPTPTMDPATSPLALKPKSIAEIESNDGLEDDRDLPPNVSTLGPSVSFKPVDQMPITLHTFPAGSVLGIGGLVSAVSVKMIEDDDKEVRETWWNELRDEIKSHAKTLGCSMIVGYSERVSISDEVAVLQCTGTAAILDLSVLNLSTIPVGKEEEEEEQEEGDGGVDDEGRPVDRPNQEVSFASLPKPMMSHRPSASSDMKGLFFDSFVRRRRRGKKVEGCQACHITYRRHESPYPMSFAKCQLCKRRYVPEILLSTIEPPPELATVGKAVLLEAHGMISDAEQFESKTSCSILRLTVCRPKKTKVAELRASAVSESIPFAQYDIHRQLMYKLRIYGLNAVFNLKIQFTVGESIMTAVATGTALFVRALPRPPALKVFRNLDVVDEEDRRLLEIQAQMMSLSERNRKIIEDALSLLEDEQGEGNDNASDTDSDSSSDSDDEREGGKDRNVVVQIDDEQDEDLVLLMDPTWPEGFEICNIAAPPKSSAFPPMQNIQLINIVKQSTISLTSHHPNRQLASVIKSIYLALQLHLSYFSPCILAGVSYDIQLPKDTTVQVSMTAVALGQMLPQPEEDDDLFFAPRYNESFAVLDDAVQGSVRPRASLKGGITRAGSVISSIGRGSVGSVVEDSFFGGEEEGVEGGVGGGGGGTSQRPSVSERGSTRRVPTMLTNLSDVLMRSGSGVVDGGNVGSPAGVRAPFGRMPTTLTLPTSGPDPPFVEITPLHYIPFGKVERYAGRLSLHFVKEAAMQYETGAGGNGMGGFAHGFLVEMQSVCRAHAVALGGNAIIGFMVDSIILNEGIKNQGYGLVSVSGDIVKMGYEEAGLEGEGVVAQG